MLINNVCVGVLMSEQCRKYLHSWQNVLKLRFWEDGRSEDFYVINEVWSRISTPTFEMKIWSLGDEELWNEGNTPEETSTFYMDRLLWIHPLAEFSIFLRIGGFWGSINLESLPLKPKHLPNPTLLGVDLQSNDIILLLSMTFRLFENMRIQLAAQTYLWIREIQCYC